MFKFLNRIVISKICLNIIIISKKNPFEQNSKIKFKTELFLGFYEANKQQIASVGFNCSSINIVYGWFILVICVLQYLHNRIHLTV